MGKTKQPPAPTRSLARVKVLGELHEVTDAKRDVHLQRTLAHVWRGKRGADNVCMNSVCILDSSGAFPHPVLGVSVTKARAYVIDRPGHAVRYTLDNAAGEDIDAHDALGIAEPGELTLHAPRGADRKGANHGDTPRPEGNKDRTRTPRGLGHVGAARRELVAVGALAGDEVPA